MTNQEKYEVVNDFFDKIEKYRNNAKCMYNNTGKCIPCGDCLLKDAPFFCATEISISEEIYKKIMNYDQKPKSQQMLEEAGLYKNTEV